MTIQFIPQRESVAVFSGEKLLATMPLYKFAAIDGELAAVANDARNAPSQKFVVPNVSYAKGLHSRNFGRFWTVLCD